MKDDLISRQQAIGEAERWLYDGDDKRTIGEMLRDLPSAQPEIVVCKDCRWGRETCGNIECFADTNVPPEYHGYEWFCPNGERRTDG